MWFCNAPSDQPICMYELGRHVALREDRGQAHLMAIGVEPGYRREQDVRVQVAMALDAQDGCMIAGTLEEHVRNIGLAVLGARKLAQDLREKARQLAEAQRQIRLRQAQEQRGAE
jgi:hypothetical protein